MITVNPRSINDLAALAQAGAPVTLTSHPGNASLYKLSLWHAGIPEHLWDITCCKADANNWPMHRLVNGTAELLIPDELHRRIVHETSSAQRFVTAYQFTREGERLGRVHVRAMLARFPDGISSCSRLLLKHKERVWELFDYLAHTRPEAVFMREITPEGILQPLDHRRASGRDLASSFLGLLEELDRLLFSDEPIETRGGACYDGVMVPLSAYLVQFWETGRTDRYDISGPDMLNYASSERHQARLSEMLAHCRKWRKDLVPKGIAIHMFPGTMARVGHIVGHPSEAIMRRKVRSLQNKLGTDKRSVQAEAQDDEKLWPIIIVPHQTPYFSQHDLVREEGVFAVDEFWKDQPLDGLQDALVRANNILRIRK